MYETLVDVGMVGLAKDVDFSDSNKKNHVAPLCFNQAAVIYLHDCHQKNIYIHFQLSPHLYDS